MINKKIFENEILANMDLLLQPTLVKSASAHNNLEKAIDYLQSAAEIFDNLGLIKKSEEVIKVLEIIANSDPHTEGLTPEKMVENLLDHGTEFNMADDPNELLDLDINYADLEVLEDEMLSSMDFEDEL